MYGGKDKSKSHWLYQFLLNASADEASDCIEPKFVKVLKHVAGPFEDGSVRKQISDGDLFMDAIFSLEAITSGILCDDSQIDWDSCNLLLKKYRVRYETPAASQNCDGGQMVLVVSVCNLDSLNHGFTPKENPLFCMTRPELQKRLQSYCRNLQPAEGSILAESSLAVSLLMAQMSEDATPRTYSQPMHDLYRCATFHGPPALKNFLISTEDQLRLDAIEEWLSDYFPVEETPTLPPSSHSDIAIQSDLSSHVRHQSPPPLPTNHPKILCDASVQVTLSQLEPRIRPTTVEVGVEVGDSLMFNTQQSVADRTRADNDLEERNLPFPVPCSAQLPPVLELCVQEFPPREEMWSSSSSLRLSCDDEPNDLQLERNDLQHEPNNLQPEPYDLQLEPNDLQLEPNDLQLDPNLEMLGQRLASSDSSENMTVEDDSPASIPAATPSLSRTPIVSGPFAQKIHLEESILDPVTTGSLHCSDPERLDPIIGSGMNLQFIQSTQIGYLSSQHCPVEPDFPLSPVMRPEEVGCSSQSFEPCTVETAPVTGARIVPRVENSPCVRNVSRWEAVSDARENVPTGGNFPNNGNIPVFADFSKGGNIPDDGNVPETGNVPNNGTVPNFENVANSGSIPTGGSVRNGANVQNGQSVSCRANVQSAVESSRTCRSVCTAENALSVGKFPNSLIGSSSCPKVPDVGNVLNSGMSPRHGRNASNNEMAPNNEKIISNSGSVDWSTLPDIHSFGSAARENEAEKCRNGDDVKSSNTSQRVSETEAPVEEVSPGRIVGRVWMSPPKQPGQRAGETETDESKAGEKLENKKGESKAGERISGEITGGTRAGDTGTAKDYEKTDNVRKDNENLSNIRTGSITVNVRTEDVRTNDVTKNDVPVVRTKAARRELNMSLSRIHTSDRCQLNPAHVSVSDKWAPASVSDPDPLSVTKMTVPANVLVSNHLASSSVSVTNQGAPAIALVSGHLSSASVSVANQEASATMSLSKQMAPARVSVSDHLAHASLSVSHQISAANSIAGLALQTFTSRSDMHVNPATLTSLSVACANVLLPVSVAGTTSSTSASVGCSTTSLADNQPKNRTKSLHQLDMVAHASGEVPRMSEQGCTDTHPCTTSKPTEHESEQTEMDSFDELLIKSAESTKLHAELEPSDSSSHIVVDPVENSAHKLKVTSVATHKKATGKSDDATTDDNKQKSGEKKTQKSLIRAKRNRLSLSQRRDPMALFAKRDFRKLPDNHKRKLFNIDHVLEGISSGSQTEGEKSNTRFGRSEKRQRTLYSAPDQKKHKGDLGTKSKKTDTREKVDVIARVTVEQPSDSGHLGNTDVVTNVTSGLKTLSHEIAKEPNCSSKEQNKKSKIGVTGVTNPALTGEELSKAVGLEHTQHDKSGLSHTNHAATHSVKDRGIATKGVNNIQTVPLEFTVAEEDTEFNRKAGALQSDSGSNCKLSENRSWSVATDKLRVGKSLHSRKRRSSIDMFTSLTKKPNNREMPEDTAYPQVTLSVVPAGTVSHDKSDTRSCDKDISTCIRTKTVSQSRDSSARNNPPSERSVLKQTVSNGDIVRGDNRGTVRDTTSLNRETVENSGSCVSEGLSKSGELQMSVPERLTLPTPKNSLPSHQPPRQSIPHDSDQLSPVNSEPSSPKFNRDRIKMLIGRDKITADVARAFSCSDLPENLKHWTYAYFKNWS